MSSIEISYVALEIDRKDVRPEFNGLSFLYSLTNTPPPHHNYIQVLKCDDEKKNFFCDDTYYDFYFVDFSPDIRQYEYFLRTGEISESYLKKIDDYNVYCRSSDEEHTLYVQFDLPCQLFDHLSSRFELIFQGNEKNDESLSLMFGSALPENKANFIPVVLGDLAINENMYAKHWQDAYGDLGQIYWAAIKNYLTYSIATIQNMHHIKHIPKKDSSGKYALDLLKGALGRMGAEPLYVWFSDMMDVFNPNELGRDGKNFIIESEFIKKNNLYADSIGIVVSPQRKLDSYTLINDTMENNRKIIKKYKVPVIENKFGRKTGWSPMLLSVRSESSIPSKLLTSLASSFLRSSSSHSPVSASHLTSSSSSASAFHLSSSSSSASASHLSSSSSKPLKAIPLKAIPFNDKKYKDYVAELSIYDIPDELKYHIKHRFETLNAILQRHPDVKVRIPLDDTLEKERKKLQAISKKLNEPYNKLEHLLGTGVHFEEWNDESKALATVNLISKLLADLSKRYPLRIDYGLIGVDVDPYNMGGKLGKKYIHVWSADVNNVFLKPSVMSSSLGTGQAALFSRHQLGEFGIVTVLLGAEGSTYIVKDTNEKDKELLREYSVPEYVHMGGGNKFSEYKKIKSDYIQLKKYYKIK